MRVSVLALTYKRTEGVGRLIRGLDNQIFSMTPPLLRIVIVDNDSAASARETVHRLSTETRWPLDYVIEPRRGLSQARNTALAHAGHSDWICFIDDDEVPDPKWIDELLRVQRTYDADVVGGRVVPYYVGPVPAWMMEGGFHNYPRYETGEEIRVAFTHNVLFRASLVSELNVRFDERWALTGGEDLHFFGTIAKAGKKIVWANDALVTEWVPQSRVSTAWILRRAFRYGTSDANVERDLYPERNPRGHPLRRGIGRIGKGLAGLPMAIFNGRRRIVWCIRQICYGSGMIAGWYGVRYREYKTTHGA